MIFHIWRFEPDLSSKTHINRLSGKISRPALTPTRTDEDNFAFEPSGCPTLRDVLSCRRYVIQWIAIVPHDVGSRTLNNNPAFPKNPATFA